MNSQILHVTSGNTHLWWNRQGLAVWAPAPLHKAMFLSFCLRTFFFHIPDPWLSPLQRSCPFPTLPKRSNEMRITSLLYKLEPLPALSTLSEQLHGGIDEKRKFSLTPEEWHPGDGACATSSWGCALDFPVKAQLSGIKNKTIAQCFTIISPPSAVWVALWDLTKSSKEK